VLSEIFRARDWHFELIFEEPMEQAEQPNYECLPQRAPRQKRKRDNVTAEKVENASDDGNAAIAPKEKSTTSASAGGAPKNQGNGIIKDAENDKAPSESGSEPAEYRACAEPGQKFECKRERGDLLKNNNSLAALFFHFFLIHNFFIFMADLDHTADVQLHSCEF